MFLSCSTKGKNIPKPEKGLSQDQITETINSNMKDIISCYKKGLSDNPQLQGRLVLIWTIGLDGKVKLVEVAESTLDNSTNNCCMEKVKFWQFDQLAGGEEVLVKFPFKLVRK